MLHLINDALTLYLALELGVWLLLGPLQKDLVFNWFCDKRI